RDRAEGTSLPTSLSDELPIGALGQADLRHEHDLVANEGAIFHRLGEAVAEETLAVAEGRGRRGVEEVHAAAQGRVHGAPVLGDVEPDAVTAKAHSADAQGLATSEGEGSVGLLTEGGARYEPRGALRRRAPLEASPPELAGSAQPVAFVRFREGAPNGVRIRQRRLTGEVLAEVDGGLGFGRLGAQRRL